MAALGARRVDGVFVSTDDPEVASVAGAYGAEVIERPADLSGDTASSESAVLHGLDALAARNIAPELVVFMQCTSPFTSSNEVDRCVAALDDPRAMAAFAVAEDHGFLWTSDPEGFAVGVNHVWTAKRKRRQELPPQYLETGAIYVMRVDAFRQTGTRFCGRVRPVITQRFCGEIDNPFDLALAAAVAPVVASKYQQHEFPPIRALVMDFDGVHTDDRVVVAQDGSESVTCSRSDGMGLERLRKAGFAMLILSKEQNPVVEARARKLRIEVRHGIEDKLAELDCWLAAAGLSYQETAYIGNDVNDAACLKAVGLPVVPSDANPAVLPIARIVTQAQGGNGALRELAEILLRQHEDGKAIAAD
jgi:N-acylneuraminate cytidylyltransferase